jgi:ATP-dependent phosphofructokinase / diphosphate-dependent phosphofructokinase
MSIGLLTAGGDCPGLNAVIRAVVVRCAAAGVPVIGILDGWEGFMDNRTIPLTRDSVRGLISRGGTILGTSRMDPYVHGAGLAGLQPTIDGAAMTAVVVIGGDGSLRTAARLEDEGLAVVGVPKTIDNDIPGTDVTFGFDTAVQIVTDAIDRLTTTAEAHNRIMVVEVMGRTAGWIAVAAGMAGGAEAIIVPEEPYQLAALAERLGRRHTNGRNYSIVVVAEGAAAPDGSALTQGTDAFGFERLGGIGQVIGRALEAATGFETRVMVLGHLQRGGTPTAYDRILATRLGVKAAELAMAGERGVMAALRGSEIVAVPLAEACAQPRSVPRQRLEEAAWFSA